MTPVTPPDSWHVFSHDGETVFCSRKGDGRVRLFEYSSAGGGERLLAELEDRPGAFGRLTATDGRFLYFTWSQTFSDLWVMDIVGQ